MDWRKSLTDDQRKEAEFALLYADWKRTVTYETAEDARLTLIARLAELLERVPETVPAGHILQVSYHSQWESDALLTKKDCGPACVEMIGEYETTTNYTTDDIMHFLTGGADRGTYISELQKAAKELYGVTLERHNLAGTEWLKAQIGKGNPAIILVHYGSFPIRMDRNYTGGHYMVVCGWEYVNYGGNPILRFVLHDPDFYGATSLTQGAFIPVTEQVLYKMWTDARLDSNPTRMALVVKR